jgi:hypothetical protein
VGLKPTIHCPWIPSLLLKKRAREMEFQWASEWWWNRRQVLLNQAAVISLPHLREESWHR